MPKKCPLHNEKYLKCPHVAKKTCPMCEESDKNHVVLLGVCIMCVFDGKETIPEHYSIADAIVKIGLGAYQLGQKQALKGDRALYLLSESQPDELTEAVHIMYSLGYKSAN